MEQRLLDEFTVDFFSSLCAGTLPGVFSGPGPLPVVGAAGLPEFATLGKDKK